MNQSEVFEKIYEEYLAQISGVDLNHVKEKLGIKIDNGTALIPFYGVLHRVSPEGIFDDQGVRPSHAVSVILCKYLLLCPESESSENDWVTYKDFKDAAPYVGGFLSTAERPISRNYSGRLHDLRTACEELTGRHVEGEINADLVMRFDALPKLPVLMVFNDRDEDFPANCSLLFERRAAKYLDMECVAIAGLVLSEWLKRKAA